MKIKIQPSTLKGHNSQREDGLHPVLLNKECLEYLDSIRQRSSLHSTYSDVILGLRSIVYNAARGLLVNLETGEIRVDDPSN